MAGAVSFPGAGRGYIERINLKTVCFFKTCTKATVGKSLLSILI